MKFAEASHAAGSEKKNLPSENESDQLRQPLAKFPIRAVTLAARGALATLLAVRVCRTARPWAAWAIARNWAVVVLSDAFNELS